MKDASRLQAFSVGFGAITFWATLIALPFSLFFAFITQLPLMLLYQRLGYQGAFMHIIATGLLGILLFILIFPFLQFGHPKVSSIAAYWSEGHIFNIQRLIIPCLIGAIGGISVGSCWHWIVFKSAFQAANR